MKLFDSKSTKELTNADLSLYFSMSGNEVEGRPATLLKYMRQLAKLKELPVIQQRTDIWYEARKSRLTASDLEEAIGNNNIKLAKKKAGIIVETTNYTSIPPLKWGTMFEPMAARCYSEERANIAIHEFGLLADEKLEHFGASPDGINDMGIMIEIKCPYSRQIEDNHIPYKYYLQIQGQLAVCKLEECDYIECQFVTYESIFSYIDDITNKYGNILNNHGVIAEYKNRDNGEYFYLYSDAGLTAANAFDNVQYKQQNLLASNLIFMKFTPWRLQQINVQRVIFDKDLWQSIVPKIDAFWQKVEECKKMPVEETVTKKTKITFITDDD